MIKSKTERRTLNRSKDSTHDLPKIKSQKRVQTAALQRKQSREALSSCQPISHNRQLKRTMSTSNACKTVQYQATSALYAKKIQQAQKHNLILEMQLNKVQQEITSMRKQTMNKKRKQQYEGEASIDHDHEHDAINKDKENNSKLAYRKNININDPKTIQNEIMIMQKKMGVMRKKIDDQIQKNKTSRNKTDAIRRQIRTLKNLNSTLLVSYQKTNQQFNAISELSKNLDEEIAEKNTLMNKMRVDNIHKKGQIIKQYDNILRKLDKQLLNENNNSKSRARTDNSRTNHFYMTEIGATGTTNEKKAEIPLKSSSLLRSNKKQTTMSNRIAGIRDHLQDLQSQFRYLNQQTGLQNASQITQNFMNKYEKNFKYYNYINNQLIKNLEEVQKEYEEAIIKRDEIMQQLHAKNSEIKIQEIIKVQANLQYVKNEKNKKIQANKQYQEYQMKVKQFIKEFCMKIKIREFQTPQESNPEIDQKDIIKLLEAIERRVKSLRDHDVNNKFNHEDYRLSPSQQTDLDQMLEATKRETSQNDKSGRMMTRQDFLKARDTLTNTKKNKSSRKAFSRK